MDDVDATILTKPSVISIEEAGAMEAHHYDSSFLLR